MTVEIQVQEEEIPFGRPTRAWSTNSNWEVLTSTPTSTDQMAHQFRFRNYAIPMTLEGEAYAYEGGHSIVEAIKKASEEFGEFEQIEVRFQDNSMLIVETSVGVNPNWYWRYFRSDGVEANGAFNDDKSYEAVARGIIGAQAMNTQVDRRS
jgi:hypothetical protein